MTKEEFLKIYNSIQNEQKAIWKSIEEHTKEEQRYINVLHNVENIMQKLDETFEQRTSLKKKDVSILMIATALQLLRIYLLPKVQEYFSDEHRLDHDDSSIKDMEEEEMRKYKESHEEKWASVKSKNKYRGWQEIACTRKVPYDAIRHSGNGYHGINMHGGQHRVKTLGHDPLLGWIFGVVNILTDTITVCPEYKNGEKNLPLPYIQSFTVDMGPDFCWKDPINNWEMFDNALESIAEDKHRLYAAFFSQGLHLSSDKFTKLGLPVPFLTLINSDKSYEIYKEGYDYLNYLDDVQVLKRTFKSASQSIFINMLIGALHKFFYNPNKDDSQQLYDVRTRKIILYSNMIATASDVVQTAVRANTGDDNSIKNFDWGGFLVTVYRLISDTEFIAKVKDEFIYKEWDRIIDSDNNLLNI